MLSRPGATGRWVFEIDFGSGSVTRHDPAEFPPHEDVERALRTRTREAELDEVVAELTGEQLRAATGEADGRTVPGVPNHWLGHVSGMTIARDDGEFVVRVDDTPVDPGATYTLATPRYVLVTDREFPTLTREMAVETGDLQYEVIVSYAREVGLAPALEGRVPRDR